MFLLGIGGFAGSGKDAFADAMVDYNSVWYKTYMSYALELALLELDPYIPIPRRWPLPRRWVRYSVLHAEVGYTESKKNKEARNLLQRLGTEVGRKMFGEQVWVDKMMEIARQHDFCMVTGIRYENELKAILDEGGSTVWISRPGVGPINAHSSDNTIGPEKFGLIIENDGSLSQLSDKARRLSDLLTNTDNRRMNV